MKKALFFFINLTVCGICLGFLNGLSTSPILQIAFTTLLTSIASIFVLFVGINDPNKSKLALFELIEKIKIFPITLFILAYTIGACYGIYIRTNDFLGAKPEIIYNRWKNYGLKKEKVIETIDKKEDTLYGIEINSCEILKNKHGENLRKELLLLNEDDFKIDKKEIERADSIKLELIKKIICK